MRGIHKSKRISWAPDVNLCQERLYLLEESPSQVGLGVQDHLQAKSSWLSHSNGMGTEDILPPGFEGAYSPNQSQINLSHIPLIKWRCPPRFQLDINWQLVAGEESKEVEIQNQRERRVLEAVYPRPSAIPPNSSVSMDIELSQYNDQQTPLIPITPIEDEVSADIQSGLIAPCSVPISSQPPVLDPGIPLHPQGSIPSISNTLVNQKPGSGMALGVDPHVVAAAATAALTQISKSNEDGNLIDHDLLIKLLSNPKSIEKLVTDYGGASKTQNIRKPTLSSVPLSGHPPPVALPDPPPVALPDPPRVCINTMETSSPSMVATSSGSLYPQGNDGGVGHHPSPWIKPSSVVPAASCPPSFGPSQAKDVNYYKSLIQQHGGDRHESTQPFSSRFGHQPGTNQEFVNNPKSRESKPKIMKPCIYLNSSRGCRHGANCAYQHDTSSQQRASNLPEVQNAKRMKMDRQISS